MTGRFSGGSFNDNLERGLFSFGAADPTTLVGCQASPLPAVCNDAGTLTLVSYYIGNTFPSVDTGNAQRTTYNNGLSFFVQDDFRARPNLTLNLEVRWEYCGPLGNFHQRPNLIAGVNPINPHWESGPDSIGYLNGATFGNLGRNAIFGPKFWNVDFSATKNTPITDRILLQVRAEVFNIFNHPNFALPNFFVSPGASQQGLISQTPDVAQTNPGLGGGGPRVIQLGLKVLL